jgi:adenosine deaminase
MRAGTIFELAGKAGLIPGGKKPEDIEGLIRVGRGANLSEYLKCFELPLKVLQEGENITRAAAELCEDMAADGVSHAQIRFAPQLHTRRMSQEEAVRAALEGLSGAGINAGLILCCMRFDRNAPENEETVRLAHKYAGRGVRGADLAGDESRRPLAYYENIIVKMREMGVLLTLHAGEAAGAGEVIRAVKYGAKRIGHGLGAAYSGEAMAMLKENDVCLEICPTSNLQTGAARSWETHPVKILREMGVRISINTDNRTVSGVTLGSEYENLKEKLGFTDGEIEECNRRAVEAL